MKNIIKLVILFLLVVSCGSSRAVVGDNKGEMTLKQYAKSSKHIELTDKELSTVKSKLLNDSTAENRLIIDKMKASIYRFYKQCAFDGTLFNINVKRGKEIYLGKNIFAYIKQEAEKTNKICFEYSTKNSDIALEIDNTIFTQEGLEFILR